MPTVSKIRDEFADNFTEHIVSIDHNVLDNYDSEFSFHAVCHPKVDDEGQTTVPDDILEFTEDISDKTDVMMHEMHVHLYVQVSEQTLGLEQEKPLQTMESESEKQPD